MARNVSTCVSGMGVNVPASMLPRSTSTPVILGQYGSVQGVGIAPIVLLGLGALGLTGGLGFWAGRGSVDTAPSTLGGEIGKQVGSGLKWAALGFIAYTLISGKNPLKNLLKK